MDFLHDGVPQMQLKAEWKRPVHADQAIEVADADQGGLLKTMLGRLNICSKEYVVRQYDHEVKGGSVIKPMVGVKRDGPSDAGVVRPRLESEAGIVLSHGICPRYSDYDAYWMMANAIDEAVRNAVAVGGDLRHMGGCDNFCWCDPVQSEKTPDGHYKLAQLVRANQALAHFCLAYGVPCVSGKDSMKNDYTGGGVKISIPPTVLFSVMGVIKDVNKTTTSDFKKAGDRIYMLGATLRELGGSELIDELKLSAAAVPQVDALAARTRYLAVHEAITSGLVNGCHDCSDGGMVVALAEMALAGRLGASVDLDKLVTVGSLNKAEALYSESASRLVVTVPAAKADAFEALFKGQHIACLGEVIDSGLFTVTSGSSKLISENVEELAKSFKGTLQF
jgi:phosphoribosylformylglycinamidine synthase